MNRRLCARLSFALLVTPFALFATMGGAAASGAGDCDGDQVVVLDARVDSIAGTSAASVTRALPTPLSPGRYSVTVTTSDSHARRTDSPQTHEQVNVLFGSTVLGPTPDLADDTDHAATSLSGEIEVLDAVSSVTATHAFSGTEGHNSVVVGCIAISRIDEPTPPEVPDPVPSGSCSGDHVATVGQRLDGRGPLPSSLVATFGTEVPAGHYEIVVVTSDGYVGRASTNQTDEQVVVHLAESTFGPTTDLADGVETTVRSSRGEVELSTPLSSFTVAHALPGVGPNSVSVDCVSLTELTPTPEVEVSIDHTCALATLIVVDFLNPGVATSASISIDGAVTELTVLAGQTTSIAIPAAPGPRALVVKVADAVVLETTYEVVCSGGGDEPGGGDDPGSGGGDGDGGDGGDVPRDGGDAPGDGDVPGDGGGVPGDGDGDGDGVGGDDAGGGGSPGSPGRDGAPREPAAGDRPLALAPLGFVPELTLSLECTGATLEATVANVGDTDGGVTLAVVPSASASSTQVASGTTTVVSLPLPESAEGTRAEVVLVADDGTVLTEALDVDCLAPADPVAEIGVDCTAGTVALTVDNLGGETIVVRAFAEQVAELGVDELVGGGSTTYEIAIDGATTPVRLVDASGRDLLREEIEHGCQQTDVEVGVSLVCPSGETLVRLTNTASESRTVVIVDGEGRESVVLAGSEERTVSRRLTGDTTIRVESRFGDVLLDERTDEWTCGSAATGVCGPDSDGNASRTVDGGDLDHCEGSSARLVLDCASGAGIVEVVNGPQRAEILVRADGVVVDERVVPADEVARFSVESAAGVRIIVEQTNSRLLDTTADCRRDPDRTATVVSALLVALMTLVAGVVARFDPWMRV